MHTTIKAAVAKFESHDLRRIRDVLSVELRAAMTTRQRGNTADLGKLEMLQAIGEVLDEQPHDGHVARSCSDVQRRGARVEGDGVKWNAGVEELGHDARVAARRCGGGVG